MEHNNSIKAYPKTVLTLYLKLYCRRRDTTCKNKMVEGIKSWLTLSAKEKKQFYKKYKECQMIHKSKLANYLKKAQPFMKKKRSVRRSFEEATTNEPVVELDNATNVKTSTSEINNSHTQHNYNNFPSAEVDGIDNNVNDAEIRESSEIRPNRVDHEPILAEPTPPSLRTARELFEMLNTNSGSNEAWTSLSNTQKSRYRRAVQLLKNDYLAKFKAYLESLPSEDLFHYYNNFFD